MGKVALSTAEEAQFRAIWADPTLTRADIAARFGIGDGTVYRTRRRLGLPDRPNNNTGPMPKIHGPTEKRFIEDWRSHMSARRIATKYGVSVQTACSTAARLGLPSKKRHKVLQAGTRDRPTCAVCGGDTGGRCGCMRGRLVA